MDLKPQFRQAWRSYRILQKKRPEPLWLRLLISTAMGLGFCALFLLSGGLFTGQLLEAGWWARTLPSNLLLCLAISYAIHALYRVVELALPAPALARINGWKDWRSALFFSAIPVVGTLLGGAIGISLAGAWMHQDLWASIELGRSFWSNFLLISAVISSVNWLRWRQRWRQQALQLQLSEARLSLLHAQIEPHFLFNTLANVQSLMETDTPRARLMLETFTDYLRASLASMREGDSSVGAELETARHYLQLLQIRMGERLAFSIEAADETLRLRLPSLLLQPLVENAIHHGLEPKLEGGHVRIRTALRDGRLSLVVEDDGLGLDAPRRAGRAARPGTGLALSNVRARLQTRYPDDNATLSLQTLQQGTRAVLDLPCPQP